MNTTSQATGEALYAAGLWLIEQRRHADAKEVFRAMLFAAPEDERGWLALGTCHEACGEIEQAFKLFSLAPSACGKALRCNVAKARILSAQGRTDLAIELYEQTAQLAEQLDDGDIAAIVTAERNLL
jgi:tetratricopeptide (TPR) repeat protein